MNNSALLVKCGALLIEYRALLMEYRHIYYIRLFYMSLLMLLVCTNIITDCGRRCQKWPQEQQPKQVQMFMSKEPYIPSTEHYVLTKGPCTLSKEPYILHKIYYSQEMRTSNSSNLALNIHSIQYLISLKIEYSWKTEYSQCLVSYPI